jgi:hydroxyacylglutathione hydrolase
MSLDSGNPDLRARAEEVNRLCKNAQATVPSRLEDELKTNPFLRPGSTEIRAKLGLGSDMPDVEAFAAIRKHKDNF